MKKQYWHIGCSSLLLSIFLFGFGASCFSSPAELRVERGWLKSYLYPPRKWVSEYNYAIEADWSARDFITNWEQIKALVKGRKYMRIPAEETIEALKASKHLLSKIRDGDIIYVHENTKVNFFIDELIDHIDANVIVILCAQMRVPSQLQNPDKLVRLLKSGKIIHLFGKNVDKSALPKNATPIPIGIRYLTQPKINREFHLSPGSIERSLDKVLDVLLPTNERNICIFFDCMENTSDSILNESQETRSDIKKKLRKAEVCDFAPRRVPWSQFMQIKGERAFDVSPRGAGVDCYRTWESLITGCIVITKRSFLDPVYEGLPVVLVDDWAEVTMPNLKKWLDEFGDVFNNPEYRERLTHKYWWKKIKDVQREYLAAKGHFPK